MCNFNSEQLQQINKNMQDMIQRYCANPEYVRYCEYYEFDKNSIETIEGFIIWKSFGSSI